MADAPNYWTLGQNLLTNFAVGGAFGSDVAKITGKIINPPSPLAAPNPAPPPAPVAGQQGVNPTANADDSGIMEHLKNNWGKYALAGGVLLVVGVLIARR